MILGVAHVSLKDTRGEQALLKPSLHDGALIRVPEKQEYQEYGTPVGDPFKPGRSLFFFLFCHVSF